MPRNERWSRSRGSWPYYFTSCGSAKRFTKRCGTIDKQWPESHRSRRTWIGTTELNRRDQVTAPKSWPSSRREIGAKVDYQVAAPTVSRTPTWQRAKIAQQRLRMEGWRQSGSVKTLRSTESNTKTVLTQTALLMEGVTSLIRTTNNSSYSVAVGLILRLIRGSTGPQDHPLRNARRVRYNALCPACPRLPLLERPLCRNSQVFRPK
jgi:hypothetical protein